MRRRQAVDLAAPAVLLRLCLRVEPAGHVRPSDHRSRRGPSAGSDTDRACPTTKPSRTRPALTPRARPVVWPDQSGTQTVSPPEALTLSQRTRAPCAAVRSPSSEGPRPSARRPPTGRAPVMVTRTTGSAAGRGPHDRAAEARDREADWGRESRGPARGEGAQGPAAAPPGPARAGRFARPVRPAPFAQAPREDRCQTGAWHSLR